MQNTDTRSLVHTVAQILFLAACAVIALTIAHSGQASAEPVCTTDYECAVWELDQAVRSGADIQEDLTFAGASGLYGLKSDLVADRFWTERAGLDYPGPAFDRALNQWLDAELGHV